MAPNVLGRLQRIIASLFAALVSLAASYAAFRWLLIKYWEWQHDKRMKITFWADERALPLAFLVSGVVFYAIFRYFERRLPENEQLPRTSLVVRTASVVVLLFLSVVAYQLYVLNQFGQSLQK